MLTRALQLSVVILKKWLGFSQEKKNPQNICILPLETLFFMDRETQLL